MVYFLVLVVFVKVLVVFSEIGVVLVVFGSGGSETLNPTLKIMHYQIFKIQKEREEDNVSSEILS